MASFGFVGDVEKVDGLCLFAVCGFHGEFLVEDCTDVGKWLPYVGGQAVALNGPGHISTNQVHVFLAFDRDQERHRET